MKIKFGFAEKVVLASLVMFTVLLAYGIIFTIQWFLYIAFAFILASSAFYTVWATVLHIKSLKAKDEKEALFTLLKLLAVGVIFLAILVMSIMCFSSAWFVLA